MKMREPHRQISPWLENAARRLSVTVVSKSQSANTSVGFLPPSSSESFLNFGPARLAMSAPVLVPPVKEIAFTSGCSTSTAPALGPRPCTTLRTPAGSPASMQSSENKYAVMGVSSEGLATTQLPAASAGASFQVNRYSGRFHGEMQPTTPRG